MGRFFRSAAFAASCLLASFASVAGAQPAPPSPYPSVAPPRVALLPPPPGEFAGPPPLPLAAPPAAYPTALGAPQPRPEPLPIAAPVLIAPPAPPIPPATPTPIVPTPVAPEAIAPEAIPPAAVGAEVAPVPEELLADAVVEAPPVAWYRPRRWLGPTPWDTGFELGINGSSGTSDTLSLRTGGFVKRKSDATKLEASLYYNSTNAEGAQTQSNALLDARNDWLLTNSPWSVFLMSQTFYDEFQAFDLNVNVTGGFAYQLIDVEWMKAVASFGSGASREFGGPQDEWVPEAQFGFDYEQSVSDTQRFYAKFDYFPEWDDFSTYRVLSELGMEIDLSRPTNTSLKMSVSDRFDSSPDGVPAHNTNYSVLLLWKR